MTYNATHTIAMYEPVYIPDTAAEMVDELHEALMEYDLKDACHQQEDKIYLFEQILFYIDRLRDMLKEED